MLLWPARAFIKEEVDEIIRESNVEARSVRRLYASRKTSKTGLIKRDVVMGIQKATDKLLGETFKAKKAPKNVTWNSARRLGLTQPSLRIAARALQVQVRTTHLFGNPHTGGIPWSKGSP